MVVVVGWWEELWRLLTPELKFFIVEKPPDFLVQNDVIVQGMIT